MAQKLLNKNYKLSKFGHALCEAAGRGETKTIEVLLHQGTDVNFNMVTMESSDCYNETPLLRASDTNQSKSALIIATMHGHTESVKLLLSRGADRLDEALGYSVEKGHSEIAAAILQYGASPDCSHHMSLTNYGYGEIHYNIPLLVIAVQKQHLELLRILLKWGANANTSMQIDSGGYNLFKHIAYKTCRNIQLQYNRWLEMIKLLLLHNADVRRARLQSGEITALSISISAMEYAIITIPPLCTRGKHIIKQCVLLLNAAGANTILEQLDTSFKRHPYLAGLVISDILPSSCSLAMMLPRNSVKLSLVDLCRDKVRRQLLDPSRGNNNNLFTAVPKLPLPQPLKKLLLFHVNINEGVDAC